MTIITSSSLIIAAAALMHPIHSFVVPPSIATFPTTDSVLSKTVSAPSFSRATPTTVSRSKRSTSIFMSSPSATSILSLTLEKPLGLILEAAEKDDQGGVIVTAVNEGGSAFESPSKDQLLQSKISTVMGADVSTLSFDWVMDAIINAPSPVVLEFAVLVAAPVAEVAVAAAPEAAIAEEAVVEEAAPATPQYETGAAVTITVQQPQSNKPDITLEARVGDNLRTTLLSNKDIELYRGLKKKLGNCGGGAQCGFCAVELIDDEGVWPERIEYEATKIGKNGSEKCRLSCVNNIVGPCTVRTL